MSDKKGRSCKCHGNRLKVCILIEETSTFSHSVTNDSIKITKAPQNCNFKYVIYLKKCKVCLEPLGSALIIIRVRVTSLEMDFQ